MRLIDADKLKQIINGYTADANPDHFDLNDKIGYGKWMHSNGYNCGISNATIAIEKAKTVPEFNVTHCSDCVYCIETSSNKLKCDYDQRYTEVNDFDFCSFAEREVLNAEQCDWCNEHTFKDCNKCEHPECIHKPK